MRAEIEVVGEGEVKFLDCYGEEGEVVGASLSCCGLGFLSGRGGWWGCWLGEMRRLWRDGWRMGFGGRSWRSRRDVERIAEWIARMERSRMRERRGPLGG